MHSTQVLELAGMINTHRGNRGRGKIWMALWNTQCAVKK